MMNMAKVQSINRSRDKNNCTLVFYKQIKTAQWKSRKKKETVGVGNNCSDAN
jgi:hypothetical protein